MTDSLDSFLLRLAYEMLLQAYRDCGHADPQLAREAQEYLRSDEASVIREALRDNSAVWSPLSFKGGRHTVRPSLRGGSG